MKRIDGFEQLKGFYSWMLCNQRLHIKPQHVSLYMYLYNRNNENFWQEWFRVNFEQAMEGSCIAGKKTYYSCLNDLHDWDLITYEKGVNNWKSSLVRLEVLKQTTTVPQPRQQGEQVTVPQDLPQHLQQLIQAAELLPTHNIKLITNNIKLITDNIKEVLEFLNDHDDMDFFSEKIEFNKFWNSYDKKVGSRDKIKKKWDALSLPVQEKILKNIPLYKESQPDKKFRKNPETYLNNDSWEDEIIQSHTQKGQADAPPVSKVATAVQTVNALRLPEDE